MIMAKKNDLGFEEDPRFAVATKESKTIWLFALLGPTAQVISAELFGRGDGRTIPLIGGLPLWIGLAFFAIPIAYVAIMLIVVNKKFSNMPLDGYLDDQAMEKYLEGDGKK